LELPLPLSLNFWGGEELHCERFCVHYIVHSAAKIVSFQVIKSVYGRPMPSFEKALKFAPRVPAV